ncbi:MAG: glycosyltransferase [Terriglobia bacterium]
MACGCAVASTDCGGIREYALHEVNALLSPSRDPRSLAGSILRLLDDDDLRQRIAQSGHERIQEFTWERSTTLLENYIQDHARLA